MQKKILVTGSAGFIGAALVRSLLDRGDKVVGVDNHNDYYDPALKEARLSLFSEHQNYIHVRTDISDSKLISDVFVKYKPEIVVNLAAQAGVRYSIENPKAYIESNVVGFGNILEACRHNQISHLVYASSSSVYGANVVMPFSTDQNVDHPLSLYAATKKSNELMAHTYSHLFKLPTTGLRFFTVYGPWGRPDMALFKFTRSILRGEPIDVYNFGKHKRDFTYIDDVVDGLLKVIDSPPSQNLNYDWSHLTPSSSSAPWKIYNIGNSRPEELIDYIQAIEMSAGVKANVNLMPMQPGDVIDTYADVSALEMDFNFRPSTSIELGIAKFVEWYKDFYKE